MKKLAVRALVFLQWTVQRAVTRRVLAMGYCSGCADLGLMVRLDKDGKCPARKAM